MFGIEGCEGIVDDEFDTSELLDKFCKTFVSTGFWTRNTSLLVRLVLGRLILLALEFELFNVVDDISEEKNMIDVEIKRASKMKQELLNWENEVYAGWKEVTPQNSHYFKINKKKANRKDIK